MAGRLLHGMAAVQRASQAGPYTVGSVAGIKNEMANFASRSFNRPGLTCNTLFLTHFNICFSFPQQLS
jgi:hypothetical protein